MVESMPQLFTMTYIMINNLNGDTIDFDTFFKLTFTSTIFSSAYALTKQLKVGPCQLMPRDKFGLTFMLIFLCNVFGLLGKGCLLAVLVFYMNNLGFASFYAPIILSITSILSPMTFVSKLQIDHFLPLFHYEIFQECCLYSYFSNSLILQ